MNKDELKKKICKIIAPYVSAWGEDERIADALIEAGYGDVKEWKRRAEAAERNDKIKERALDLICDTTMKNANIIVFPDSRTQVKNKIELYNYFIQQAEREIAEEERK